MMTCVLTQKQSSGVVQLQQRASRRTAQGSASRQLLPCQACLPPSLMCPPACIALHCSASEGQLRGLRLLHAVLRAEVGPGLAGQVLPLEGRQLLGRLLVQLTQLGVAGADDLQGQGRPGQGCFSERYPCLGRLWRWQGSIHGGGSRGWRSQPALPASSHKQRAEQQLLLLHNRSHNLQPRPRTFQRRGGSVSLPRLRRKARRVLMWCAGLHRKGEKRRNSSSRLPAMPASSRRVSLAGRSTMSSGLGGGGGSLAAAAVLALALESRCWWGVCRCGSIQLRWPCCCLCCGAIDVRLLNWQACVQVAMRYQGWLQAQASGGRHGDRRQEGRRSGTTHAPSPAWRAARNTLPSLAYCLEPPTSAAGKPGVQRKDLQTLASWQQRTLAPADSTQLGG